MSITVRYFASLAEHLGRSQDIIEIQPNSTVLDCWLMVNTEQPIPDNTLAAVNMEYSGFDAVVREGDEVAFFPPVTGG